MKELHSRMPKDPEEPGQGPKEEDPDDD